jgi:hypothetical protein
MVVPGGQQSRLLIHHLYIYELIISYEAVDDRRDGLLPLAAHHLSLIHFFFFLHFFASSLLLAIY